MLINNYRTVSLWHVFSKFIEKFMYDSGFFREQTVAVI